MPAYLTGGTSCTHLLAQPHASPLCGFAWRPAARLPTPAVCRLSPCPPATYSLTLLQHASIWLHVGARNRHAGGCRCSHHHLPSRRHGHRLPNAGQLLRVSSKCAHDVANLIFPCTTMTGPAHLGCSGCWVLPSLAAAVPTCFCSRGAAAHPRSLRCLRSMGPHILTPWPCATSLPLQAGGPISLWLVTL